MRTTVTLDDDVVQIIRRIMRDEDKSFKEAINDGLRRVARPTRSGRRRRFRVRPHDSAFAGGVDLGRLNQLADELEAEAALAKLGRKRPA